MMPAITSESALNLIDWYLKNRREFPWRVPSGEPKKRPSPYYVWLAEIMSQQTVMAALLPYFERFVTAFPTVESLASANEDDVMHKWAGLGYYSRARNLHKAAKVIVGLGGFQKFPKTYEAWIGLPGVGPYTAAAVVSQCFGVPEPVWDGNVLRVMSRMLARSDVFAGEFKTETMASLRQTLEAAQIEPSYFNQGLMELGATVCVPRVPRCAVCPVKKDCKAFSENRTHELPPPKPRREFVVLKPRVWVVTRESSSTRGREFYLEKREHGNWFADLWDFPSELGGSKSPVLVRKISEDTAKSAMKLKPIKHTVTHHKILLHPMLLKAKTTEKNLLALSSQGRWFSLQELTESVPIATTAKKVLRVVMGQLSQ